MLRKDGHLPWQMGNEHREVINYTLDGVSKHTVTTQIQAFFLTQFPGMKQNAQGFHHEANGDFKTVRV